MTISLSDDAVNDLKMSYLFYNESNPGLGQYFLDSIYSDLDSLRFYAGIHLQINSYYRMLAKRFPFAIYYRIQDDKVFIDAILDCRSDPKKHIERLHMI